MMSDRALTFLLLGSLIMPAICIDKNKIMRTTKSSKSAHNRTSSKGNVAFNVNSMASVDEGEGMNFQAKKEHTSAGGHFSLAERSAKANSSKAEGKNSNERPWKLLFRQTFVNTDMTDRANFWTQGVWSKKFRR